MLRFRLYVDIYKQIMLQMAKFLQLIEDSLTKPTDETALALDFC